MAKIKYFVLASAAVLVYTASAKAAPANNASTPGNAENTPRAGLTKGAPIALENSAYAAWKTKDAKFWNSFLSDKFVGWVAAGRFDKSSAAKEFTGADCAIKSYVLSDEQMRPLGEGTSLITYKVTVDGTCGGHEVPANSWAASLYVRDGDT